MYYKFGFYAFLLLFSTLSRAGIIDEHRIDNGKNTVWKIHTRLERFINELSANPYSPPFLWLDPHLRYFVGGSVNFHNHFLKLDTGYTYSHRENYHYIRPYQLALKIPVLDGQWVIGRHLVEWDWADSLWNRGLWQPFYREDALRAKQGGLIGIFREFSYRDVKFTLFGSPVFVPESGPAFRVENGQLKSNNPWFTPPPNEEIGFGKIVPSYNLPEVNWRDFYRFSLAGLAVYKNFYLGYAYKNINKPLVKTQFVINLTDTPQGSHETGYKVPVPLETVFLKHHIAVLGWNVEHAHPTNKGGQQIYRLKTSITYDQPESFVPAKKDIVFFPVEREWHLSVKGELNVQDDYEQTQLYVSYTHQLQDTTVKAKGLLSEIFPNPDEQQFFRNDLFQFNKAVSVGLHHVLKWTDSESADLAGRFIYHIDKKYFMFSFRGAVTFSGSLSFFLEGDLLFTEFPFYADNIQTDIGLYKNKSRLFGGMSYAF